MAELIPPRRSEFLTREGVPTQRFAEYLELLTSTTNTSVRIIGSEILDFGAGSMTVETIVTGVTSITASSFVKVDLRIEDTVDHSVDELIIDPILVDAHSFVTGVGFTITGSMFNAPTTGVYAVNWVLY